MFNYFTIKATNTKASRYCKQRNAFLKYLFLIKLYYKKCVLLGFVLSYFSISIKHTKSN